MGDVKDRKKIEAELSEKGREKKKKEKKAKDGNRHDKKWGIAHAIQTRIGRTVVLSFAVIMFCSIAIVNYQMTEANDTELSLESELAAHEISEFFAPCVRMTEQLAANPELQLLLKTLSVAENTAKHSGYPDALANLVEIKELDTENILAVWFADLDASVAVMSDGYITEPGWDVTTRPWYACIEAGETVFTVPYEDTNTGQLVLTLGTPIYDSMGTAIGVAGMDLSMETVMNTVRGRVVGDSGYIMLFANDGTYIYHPEEAVVGTNVFDADVSQNVKDAISQQAEGIMMYNAGGETRYGYLAQIEGTGYMILSSMTQLDYSSALVIMAILFIVVLATGLFAIIISLRKAVAKITRPIGELNEAALQLAEGNLDVVLNVTSNDEIGELGKSITKTVDRLKEYINYIDEIAAVLARMADGKLSIRLKYAYVGEFAKVKEALYHISSSMTEVMKDIAGTSNNLSSGSDDLARAAQGLAEGSESQAAYIEELVATATTVAEQVEENMQDSEKSAEHTREVNSMMDESRELMEQMRIAMDKIQESSKQVVGIIQAIEDIAEQTNLLSLNASIEAARAGEAGRGFAVVAGEIGNLANESARAVNTTRDLISVSLSEIEKGNALTERVVDSLSQAVDKVEEVNAMIQKGAENAVLQMQSMNQIRDGVEVMSQGVQDNSAMAQQTSATSEELAAQAATLNELVGKFDLN